MVYVTNINCIDGDIFALLLRHSPLKRKMEGFFWQRINNLPLVERIEDKYWGGTLDLLDTFDKAVKRKYEEQIGEILDGFEDGEVW